MNENKLMELIKDVALNYYVATKKGDKYFENFEDDDDDFEEGRTALDGYDYNDTLRMLRDLLSTLKDENIITSDMLEEELKDNDYYEEDF